MQAELRPRMSAPAGAEAIAAAFLLSGVLGLGIELVVPFAAQSLLDETAAT